jgi:hypothetical protein
VQHHPHGMGLHSVVAGNCRHASRDYRPDKAMCLSSGIILLYEEASPAIINERT